MFEYDNGNSNSFAVHFFILFGCIIVYLNLWWLFCHCYIFHFNWPYGFPFGFYSFSIVFFNWCAMIFKSTTNHELSGWFNFGWHTRKYLHCMANCWQPPHDLLKLARNRILPNEIKCFHVSRCYFFLLLPFRLRSKNDCVFFPVVIFVVVSLRLMVADCISTSLARFWFCAWPQQKPKCLPQFRFSTRFTLNLFYIYFFWLFFFTSSSSLHFFSFLSLLLLLVSANYYLRDLCLLACVILRNAWFDHDILFGNISIWGNWGICKKHEEK